MGKREFVGKYNQETLRKINEARKFVGKAPLVIKKMKCLKCGKEFISQDAVNQRLCDRCRNANKRL